MVREGFDPNRISDPLFFKDEVCLISCAVVGFIFACLVSCAAVSDDAQVCTSGQSSVRAHCQRANPRLMVARSPAPLLFVRAALVRRFRFPVQVGFAVRHHCLSCSCVARIARCALCRHSTASRSFSTLAPSRPHGLLKHVLSTSEKCRKTRAASSTCTNELIYSRKCLDFSTIAVGPRSL